MPNSSTLIFIHGFNSSPQAAKAQEIASYLQTFQLDISFLHPWVPSLPCQAINALQSLVERCESEQIALIGSSLGGYYATYLAERFKLRAVLVNPAVRPDELMRDYLGQNHNPYSDEDYVLRESHMAELRDLRIERMSHPENILLMVQTGDETLNFAEASAKFSTSPCIIEHGGDHRYQGFENWIPYCLAFLFPPGNSSCSPGTMRV